LPEEAIMVKQVSIFLENREGRLYEVSRLLSQNNLNIRALSIADTSDFGILRLIIDDPDRTIELLKKDNYTVSATDVLAIEVDDRPGGLAKILGIFNENHINIEYMYAFLGKLPGKAIMIFRFDNNKLVLEKLKNKEVTFIGEKELYSL
jgi:hypothetical protein